MRSKKRPVLLRKTGYNRLPGRSRVDRTATADHHGAGVGGVGGYLEIGGGEFNAQKTGLTKTAGSVYETGYLILIGTPASDINDYRAEFVRSTGSNFAGGGDSAHAYLRSDSGVSTYTIELFGSSSPTGDETAPFSLTANTWYELRVQMTLNTDTNVDLTAGLYNRGADGTSPAMLVSGSAVSTLSSISLTNSGFNGSDVFSGFTTRNNTGIVGQAMDNYDFTIIPEPGSLALVGLTLGTLLIIRKHF